MDVVGGRESCNMLLRRMRAGEGKSWLGCARRFPRGVQFDLEREEKKVEVKLDLYRTDILPKNGFPLIYFFMFQFPRFGL